MIYEHSAVTEAGVVGRKDAFWGETVVAHVALRPGQRLDEQELIAFARERLADYKDPQPSYFGPNSPKGQPVKFSGARFAGRSVQAQ